MSSFYFRYSACLLTLALLVGCEQLPDSVAPAPTTSTAANSQAPQQTGCEDGECGGGADMDGGTLPGVIVVGTPAPPTTPPPVPLPGGNTGANAGGGNNSGSTGHGGGSGGTGTGPNGGVTEESPIFGPPDPEDVKCDQLRNLNGEPRNSFNAFADANAGLTRAVIIGQRANRSITGLGSQPVGPNIRYVEDPLNRDVIIDLRHMLVVGSYTRAVGNDVERLQWASGQASGDNHQDYYSNELGYAFYARYSLAIQLNPHEFVNYLITFLNDPSDRVPLTDPAEINRVCP